MKLYLGLLTVSSFPEKCWLDLYENGCSSLSESPGSHPCCDLGMWVIASLRTKQTPRKAGRRKQKKSIPLMTSLDLWTKSSWKSIYLWSYQLSEPLNYFYLRSLNWVFCCLQPQNLNNTQLTPEPLRQIPRSLDQGKSVKKVCFQVKLDLSASIGWESIAYLFICSIHIWDPALC